MRTKDEVVAYLKEHGHSNIAVTKIMGFLIGNGMKEPKENIVVKRGLDSWEDFYRWYEGIPEPEHPLTAIMRILMEKEANAKTSDEAELMHSCMAWLTRDFVFDATPIFPTPCERKSKKR